MDPNHFAVDPDTGGIYPQPWMQWRQVASAVQLSKSGSYVTSGGGNKNDPLHSVTASWTNDTPINQMVYGMVTRGGATMVLTARSRAYLLMGHAQAIAPAALAIVAVSQLGLGYDVGLGGVLDAGPGYCVGEVRQPAVSMPLSPQITGWTTLTPGQTFSGQVVLAYVSDNWESGTISGGSSGTESSYITGDTRLDLFAIPVI